MPNSPEEMAEIIEKLARDKGKSPRSVSLEATDKPDAFREMKRGKMPGAARVAAFARILDVPVDRLTGSVAPLGETRISWNGFEGPPDMPLYGTALGGEFKPNGNRGIESTIVMMNEVVDYLRRPASLNGRRDAYALYVAGSSMEPRYEPGDTVCVDPKRPPANGDDVIVQLVAAIEEEHEFETCLIKRLVKRGAGFVELRQYNPDITFKIELDRIASMHRVYTMGDLLR